MRNWLVFELVKFFVIKFEKQMSLKSEIFKSKNNIVAMVRPQFHNPGIMFTFD